MPVVTAAVIFTFSSHTHMHAGKQTYRVGKLHPDPPTG